jgi:hypothetical protein
MSQQRHVKFRRKICSYRANNVVTDWRSPFLYPRLAPIIWGINMQLDCMYTHDNACTCAPHTTCTKRALVFNLHIRGVCVDACSLYFGRTKCIHFMHGLYFLAITIFRPRVPSQQISVCLVVHFNSNRKMQDKDLWPQGVYTCSLMFLCWTVASRDFGHIQTDKRAKQYVSPRNEHFVWIRQHKFIQLHNSYVHNLILN